jgi:hypothetical protein
MAKNKTDKRINKIVKQINRELKQDVFGDRFWLKQIRKTRVDGLNYYLYELKDRQEPNRDSYTKSWIWGESQFVISSFNESINDFIVRSDFWAKYWNDETKYKKELDIYLK